MRISMYRVDAGEISWVPTQAASTVGFTRQSLGIRIIIQASTRKAFHWGLNARSALLWPSQKIPRWQNIILPRSSPCYTYHSHSSSCGLFQTICHSEKSHFTKTSDLCLAQLGDDSLPDLPSALREHLQDTWNVFAAKICIFYIFIPIWHPWSLMS